MSDKEKRVYGRRAGRPLNQGRLEVMDTVFPEIEIPASILTEEGNRSAADIIGKLTKQAWLEIGFGNGEHLSGLMRRHPDYGFMGAEPFINGMSAFLKDIEKEPHDKIRVLMDDAMMIANSLAEDTLDGIYVLNPDPWHKKRHHKRRIINQTNLDCFARILKPGAELIMSTDVPDLAEWMFTHATIHPNFKWTGNSKQDWDTKPEGWITTRYEEKKAKGADKMVYMLFKCKK